MSIFWQKSGFFTFLERHKSAKNAKISNSRTTIFLPPTRMLYSKFHPKIMKIENLMGILQIIEVENRVDFYIKGFPYDLEPPRYFEDP